MISLMNNCILNEQPPQGEDPDQNESVLTEMEKIRYSCPEEYNRLSELLRQGNIETVLQIIHHRKAVDHLKNLSPLL